MTGGICYCCVYISVYKNIQAFLGIYRDSVCACICYACYHSYVLHAVVVLCNK